MTPPDPGEILLLWQGTLPHYVPHERGLTQRLSGHLELIWRRDDVGRLTALAAFQAPGDHAYGSVKLLLVHPSWQRRGLGRGLLQEGQARLGAVPLVVGQERQHFFAGATPLSVPFWQACGFELTGSAPVDLRCELRGFRTSELPGGVRLTSAEEPGILEEVLRLTQKVFSPRWTFDVSTAGQVAPHQVLALVQGEEVSGFALVGTENDPAILPSFLYPQALREGLGRCSGLVGGLGPIGLRPEARGSGLGRAFMLAAMQTLKSRGVQYMGIDWTGIAPFYQKLGFKVWNEHQQMRRQA